MQKPKMNLKYNLSSFTNSINVLVYNTYLLKFLFSYKQVDIERIWMSSIWLLRDRSLYPLFYMCDSENVSVTRIFYNCGDCSSVRCCNGCASLGPLKMLQWSSHMRESGHMLTMSRLILFGQCRNSEIQGFDEMWNWLNFIYIPELIFVFRFDWIGFLNMIHHCWIIFGLVVYIAGCNSLVEVLVLEENHVSCQGSIQLRWDC